MTTDKHAAERLAEFLAPQDTATGNLARAHLELLLAFRAAFQAGLDAEAEIDSLRCELDEANEEAVEEMGEI